MLDAYDTREACVIGGIECTPADLVSKKVLWTRKIYAIPPISDLTKESRGWMDVTFDDGRRVPVPQYLKVEVYKVENNRDYFIFLEGWDSSDNTPLKGKKASLSHEKIESSYKSRLIEKLPHSNSPAKIKINITTHQLWYGDAINPIPAFTQEEDHVQENGYIQKNDPLPVGKWKVAIPKSPHGEAALSYLKFSPFATTWFHIETPITTDRFIHVGAISHGCATIGTDRWKNDKYDTNDPLIRESFENWTKFYEYLIISRADDLYVGEIEVVK